MSDSARHQYKSEGYVIARGLLSDDAFAALERAFAAVQAKETVLMPMYEANFATQMDGWHDCQRDVYEAMRERSELADFADNPSIRNAVSQLIGAKFRSHAVRFRMDLPHDTRFVAHWHQDHAYVGGSIDTVTAWVPLQDTDWPMGPLLVAPRSHHRGILLHEEHQVRGRQTPIIDLPWDTLPLQMLPMRRGDVLFFHSLLLHSGQVNFSDRVRYSVQIRYEPTT